MDRRLRRRACGRGYATSVIRRHVRAAAIFGAWLRRQGLAAVEVDEAVVTRFVSGLPRWQAPQRRHGRESEVASGIRLFAGYLRAQGVVATPKPTADRSETEQWLQDFDDHLVQVHGLVGGTRRIYRRHAGAFLAECVGGPTPDWSRVTVPTIAAFVQARVGRLRPSARRNPATATRALLRFLVSRGVVPAGVEGAVPAVREWKHAALPRVLTADDAERVLAAVDETRAGGARDRAVLLLLSRLGLRAGEVAALTVPDIDWHNGVVRVAGKGGRGRPLPLPADVGAALVAALRSRPPASPPQAIFRARSSAVPAAPRGGRDGDSDPGPAPGRPRRPPARRARLPAHLRIADGPSRRADEGGRRPARSRQAAHHRHLRQAGPRDAGDDRPAVAGGRTMTGEAWREHLRAYVELRRALGYTIRPDERLLHDFVDHLERRADDVPAAEVAVEWATATAESQHARRLSIVRGFLTMVRAADPCVDLPRAGCFAAADAGPRGSSHSTRSAP